MDQFLYNGVKLYEYCEENFLNYKLLRKSILYHQKVKNLPLDTIISRVIKFYLRKKEFNKYKNNFEQINEYENFNVYRITKELNINYSAFYRLLKMGYSKKEIMYIIWFLHDKEENGLSISIGKLNYIKNIIDNNDYDSIDDFMVLLTLFKLGYISDEKLFNYRIKYLKILITRYVTIYRIDRNLIEDIINDIYIYEHQLYFKLIANNIEQNIKYLNISTRWKIIDIIHETYKCNTISLDSNINDKQTYYDIIY
ncbi:MAG: hypothetical protein NC181_03845 [Clostridium sp.]|nr:hypothetical protein [Clostridium sp.]MCM1444247.1 hypothetical protein [Candidatus Amulumruptor caecigallinarius]